MSLQKSILNTLKYSSLFNFPLTDKEVYKYLISEEGYSYKKVSGALKSLTDNNKINEIDGFYFLREGSKGWVDSRKKSQKTYKRLIEKSKRELKFLSKIPFIKFIGVTGSVSAKNIKKKSDIDLFFITSKNFLWAARLIVVLFLKYKNIYRNPYCPNIYISEETMEWEKKNVYVANEIARLKPLVNKNHTYEKFLQKNKWVVDFLPNFKYYLPKYNLDFSINFLLHFLFPLELILFTSQYLYMKRKITSEVVGLKKILFLKNDYSRDVLRDFHGK